MKLLLPFVFGLAMVLAAMVSYIVYRVLTAKPSELPPQSPLAQAVFDEELDRVAALLEVGADPNSALNVAYLIEPDGNISTSFDAPIIGEARQKEGMTALAYAALQGNTEIVRLLLSKGADANRADKYGQTPLMLAAWKGDLESVNLLLNRHADLTAIDNSGRTALVWAQIEGHADVEELLASR
jgi:ankyrin repeat protein